MSYKRFMVFEYGDYYPGGGLSDCCNDFDTLEEAMANPPDGDSTYIWDRISDRTWDAKWDGDRKAWPDTGAWE